MNRVPSLPFAPAVLACAVALMLGLSGVRAADGSPEYQPAAYAIKGAKIVTGTGPAIEPGTVVIRRGVIEAVGQADAVAIPYDAEPIDGKGLVVYAGFLDLYTTLGIPPGTNRSRTGNGRNVSFADFALASTQPDHRLGLTPEFEAAAVLDLADTTAEERRKLGFTDLLAAPGGPIASGQSALVALGGLPRREAVVKTPVALHILMARPGGDPGEDEGDDCEAGLSAMGVEALTAPGDENRRRSFSLSYPNSLMGVTAHLRQAMLDADHDRELWAFYEARGGVRPPLDPCLKALQAARTKTIATWWEANTRDDIDRALDLAEEFGTTAVIVGGSEAYKLADRLKATGTSVVMRLDFPEEPKVPTESEYRAKPLEERHEPLRVIADRARRWKERVAGAGVLVRAGVKVAFASDGLQKPDTFHAQVRKLIAAGLTTDEAVACLTRNAADIAGIGMKLGTIEPGKLGHVVAWSGAYGEEKAKARWMFVDGVKFDLEKANKKKDGGRKPGEGDTDKEKKDEKPKDAPKPPDTKPEGPKPAEPFTDVATELDEDRRPKLKTNGEVLIRDVTILTVSKAGTVPRGSLLVRGGKISAIGLELEAPAGMPVIEASGMVAMPGIIDTHSHMAIQGGVNEVSLSIVPEVRVRDVVTGEEPTVYRALAGGTTTARLLHGSANTIGGQDAIIKLKPGRSGREIRLDDPRRPQGVKFALGENVTRVPNRFPNTRMGVESVIERAFQEAKAYRDAWTAYRAGDPEKAPPPRRDLRLEALAAMLDGSIKIHSHCYRNDEILMLLRTAERHGVRVQSLQHVLEGYKVAAEIAAHGASASTFSDWWAYKIEAFDAIPHNAALLTEAGARVCIKSDSEELVRHLYLEAAKAVKYGGASEAQALEMITLNPARELGLDHRLGTIEVGKDADIALFNAHPFDSYARCEMTLVDGEVHFQRRSAEARLTPRPGPHTAMPQPSPESRARTVDLTTDPKGVYAIVGATLHTVTGADIRDGVLVIAEGKIAAVGGPGTAIPPEARRIDAAGLDVWPGLIDAGNVVGLFEVGSLRETRDFSDIAKHQPELRASTALHPDSELVPVTRANGVLGSFTQPQGGVIAGQGAVIELDGWVPSEMVVQDATALVVNIPPYRVPNPEKPAKPDDDPNKARAEELDALRELFRRAVAYDGIVREAAARKALPPTPDPRMAALVPYAKGEKPVIFSADQRVDILDAIKLARDLNLKGMVSGGLEAWKVAGELKAAGMPVIVGGTLRIPSGTTDPYDAAYANPAKLVEAGVTIAIRSAGAGPDNATAPRNLPYEAATAVAYGLPEIEAIRAVTISPARLLGVADRLGSLEAGKRANVVITAGPILQVSTEVKGLFIGGKPVAPDSKHTRLYEKFRGRLAEVKAGKAPLGLERGANGGGSSPTGEASRPATPAGRR